MAELILARVSSDCRCPRRASAILSLVSWDIGRRFDLFGLLELIEDGVAGSEVRASGMGEIGELASM